MLVESLADMRGIRPVRLRCELNEPLNLVLIEVEGDLCHVFLHGYTLSTHGYTLSIRFNATRLNGRHDSLRSNI
jgi:hypothetical protein